MQQNRKRIDEAIEKNQKELENKDKEVEKFMIEVAILYFKLNKYSERYAGKIMEVGLKREGKGLTILKDEFKDFLSRYGLTLEDPTGVEMNDELRKKVDVQSNIKDETVSSEIIRTTWSPIIYCNGVLIKPGVVDVSIPVREEG
jgi:molecular chaperone GrpE (heat shock protein)